MASLTLMRFSKTDAGIFSHLLSEDRQLIAYALEHAYNDEPKIPDGEFKCVRGMHRLHDDSPEFETFEVTGVEGHTGLLFHCGNFQYESKGCVLLGSGIEGDMLTRSRDAFAKFMEFMNGVDEFELVVC